MGFKTKMGSGEFNEKIIPGGVYRARVDKVRLNTKGNYGHSWAFDFIIIAPQQFAGTKKSALVSIELKPGWKLDRWLKAITGMSFKEGDEVDSDICLGKIVDLMIVESRDVQGNLVGDKITELYKASGTPQEGMAQQANTQTQENQSPPAASKDSAPPAASKDSAPPAASKDSAPPASNQGQDDNDKPPAGKKFSF